MNNLVKMLGPLNISTHIFLQEILEHKLYTFSQRKGVIIDNFCLKIEGILLAKSLPIHFELNLRKKKIF